MELSYGGLAPPLRRYRTSASLPFCIAIVAVFVLAAASTVFAQSPSVSTHEDAADAHPGTTSLPPVTVYSRRRTPQPASVEAPEPSLPDGIVFNGGPPVEQ